MYMKQIAANKHFQERETWNLSLNNENEVAKEITIRANCDCQNLPIN